jgi:hypothetical protein
MNLHGDEIGVIEFVHWNEAQDTCKRRHIDHGSFSIAIDVYHSIEHENFLHMFVIC